MRDIAVRLSYTHVPCTCFSKSKDAMQHDELCTHRVVREAELEILRLRDKTKDKL